MLMRATVCLCNSDGCNGDGVPTEDATDNHHVVEIQQLKTKAAADALKNTTSDNMNTSGDLRAALQFENIVYLAIISLSLLLNT